MAIDPKTEEFIRDLYQTQMEAMRDRAAARVTFGRDAFLKHFGKDDSIPLDAVIAMLLMIEKSIREIKVP